MMKKYGTFALASLAWIGLATPGFAATIFVPSDQPTIEDAIAAAESGDVIHVEAGTYNEKLEIPLGLDDLTIEGEPGGGSVLEGTPGLSDNLIRVRANRATIQDLEMVGGNVAIKIDYSTGTRVQFVTSTGAREGVRVTNGADNSVADCTVRDTTGGMGIKVSGSPRTAVTNNTVENARRQGIVVQNSAGATLTNNTVTNARGGDGIRASRVAAGSVVGNTVSGSYANGIRIQSSPDVAVELNQSDRNRNYGIRVEASAPISAVSDLENAGNTATDNKSGAFRVVP